MTYTNTISLNIGIILLLIIGAHAVADHSKFRPMLATVMIGCIFIVSMCFAMIITSERSTTSEAWSWRVSICPPLFNQSSGNLCKFDSSPVTLSDGNVYLPDSSFNRKDVNLGKINRIVNSTPEWSADLTSLCSSRDSPFPDLDIICK